MVNIIVIEYYSKLVNNGQFGKNKRGKLWLSGVSTGLATDSKSHWWQQKPHAVIIASAPHKTLAMLPAL